MDAFHCKQIIPQQILGFFWGGKRAKNPERKKIDC